MAELQRFPDDREFVVPDGIEPFRGYRVWRIRKGRLYSTVQDFEWQDRRLEAECIVADGSRFMLNVNGRLERLTPAHPAPDEHCSCGFYALKTYAEASRMLPISVWPFQRVVGQVLLDGKVIEGTRGFRGERVEIGCLLYPKGDLFSRFFLRRVARQYGIHLRAAPTWVRPFGDGYSQTLILYLLAQIGITVFGLPLVGTLLAFVYAMGVLGNGVWKLIASSGRKPGGRFFRRTRRRLRLRRERLQRRKELRRAARRARKSH